jgi:putative heme-binding domain-containing protein
MRTDLFALALGVVAGLTANAQAAPSAAEVEAGGNLFIITCSSSFCHGEGGIGARGPSLRNRNFPPDFVRNTVLNGRSGTPMPSFKDSLTPAELTLIVNYVMSLSPNNHQDDAGASTQVQSAGPVPLSDQAQHGYDLFFDETKPDGCDACHSYGGKGGLVGPDLSKFAAKTPAAIYQSIIHPTAWTDYPFLTVTTKDGGAATGIKHDQDEKQIGIYDVTSAPPVLRTFYAADGAKAAPADGPLYKHELNGYSASEIADLIAFLKSAGGDGKTVTPQELGLK